MDRYIIVKGEGRNELLKNCNKMISNGYVPTGGILVEKITSKGKFIFYFMQAMYKEDNIKDTYTVNEVVRFLVNNNNMVMDLIGDNKYFIIEGNEVVSYRKRFLFKDQELNRYSFEHIINEVS